MIKMCLLCVLCSCILSDFRETASRNMAPRITEPLKNVSIEVETGAEIDLCCSVLLESESSVVATIIYWLINGTFTENYSGVQESYRMMSKKGDHNYLTITLHINNVAPNFYNIPITCIANSPWGADNSTVYLKAFKTGFSKWAVIIPVCLVFSLLLVPAYKYLIPLTTTPFSPL